jgi:hypothetical protein
VVGIVSETASTKVAQVDISAARLLVFLIVIGVADTFGTWDSSWT